MQITLPELEHITGRAAGALTRLARAAASAPDAATVAAELSAALQGGLGADQVRHQEVIQDGSGVDAHVSTADGGLDFDYGFLLAAGQSGTARVLATGRTQWIPDARDGSVMRPALVER